MTADKLEVGQEVRVRTPHGTYPGEVTYVGRKLATIRYNGRGQEFEMATRRSRGLQVGGGTFYEVIDPDSDAEQERWSAAVDALEAEGIHLDSRHELSLAQLEAMAAIAHDDGKER